MKVFAYPLIPFTIFLSLGIVANYYLNLDLNIIVSLIALFLLLLLGSWFYMKKSWKPTIFYGVFTYSLACVFGFLIQNFHLHTNSKTHYSTFLNEQEIYQLKGVVTANFKTTEKNYKHLVSITEVNSKKANGKILTYVKKSSKKELIPGDEIVFIAELQPIPNNFNPYQFDYATYLKHQNVYHQVFLKDNDHLLVKHYKNWDSFWFHLQNKLVTSFNIHKFSDENKSILNSLLFGQRKLLDKETITTYSNAGIIHILAISGLHVGIIYLLLLFVLKPLTRIKKGKTIELILILFFLWSFATLTGLSASVTRAVTMFSIIAIGKYYNRNTNTFNTIAFSALLLLIINPNFIFDVGFQMSYAAVIAIVALHPFFHYFYFNKSKITKFFIDLTLVSLAAQIGVLPLSLFYFNQFPILFLVANIVVIPLATFILWLGIATLLLNFIFPKIALYLGYILDFSITILNNYAKWISSFENFIIKNISFNFSLCILSYTLILLFIYWCYNRKIEIFRYVLLSIIFLQLGFLFTKDKAIRNSEFIFFNSKKPLISYKTEDNIYYHTNDIENNTENINHYKRGSFAQNIEILPLENIYIFNKERILIIDSVYYSIEEKPSILFITNNPKINLERVLNETEPKQVIADNSNPFYKIEQWKTTCRKRKIPFHATAEKGFYKLN